MTTEIPLYWLLAIIPAYLSWAGGLNLARASRARRAGNPTDDDALAAGLGCLLIVVAVALLDAFFLGRASA